MTSKQGILILIFFGVVLAEPTFIFAYGASAFLAWKATLGVDQAKAIYVSCVEKTNDGSMTSTNALCVCDIFKYIFGAAASFVNGGYGVSLINDGMGGAQQSHNAAYPPTATATATTLTTIRRTVTRHQRLLDGFNEQLTRDHGQGVQANAIVDSEVHPSDGFAIQMNVHNDDSILHLHTNGSHMMALFHKESSDLARRATLYTDGHYYQFTGLGGLKVEYHNINYDPDGGHDFGPIMQRFARSNLAPTPILEQANSWDYQVCNTARTATFFYGTIAFESSEPTLDYTPISPRGCNG